MRIVKAQDVQMGPVTLKQPLPIGVIEQIDPFLLLHHVGPEHQEPHQRNIMDIGGHPHRGFEPVSFIFKGAVHHRDSRDNDSVIHAGGVQWMTAGRGIIHSESAAKSFVEKGGELELIQLWVNLPADQKMVQPHYQGFQKEQIPVFEDQEGKVRVNVVAGQFNGLTGPVDSLTGARALTLELKAGGKVHLEESAERNAILYQLHGLARANDIGMGDAKMAIFRQDGDRIEIEAKTDSTLLYVSGQPIGEEVTQYGPFVMNTQTEVLEAMRDFQMGKMGVLI
ncbi:MAG: pirin family protein [Bacteroidota bacterium]